MNIMSATEKPKSDIVSLLLYCVILVARCLIKAFVFLYKMIYYVKK